MHIYNVYIYKTKNLLKVYEKRTFIKSNVWLFFTKA